jgi:hypothetical protein
MSISFIKLEDLSMFHLLLGHLSIINLPMIESIFNWDSPNFPKTMFFQNTLQKEDTTNHSIWLFNLSIQEFVDLMKVWNPTSRPHI